jgi:hypothetical protein
MGGFTDRTQKKHDAELLNLGKKYFGDVREFDEKMPDSFFSEIMTFERDENLVKGDPLTRQKVMMYRKLASDLRYELHDEAARQSWNVVKWYFYVGSIIFLSISVALILWSLHSKPAEQSAAPVTPGFVSQIFNRLMGGAQ